MITIYGRHDAHAIFEDDNGLARIPLDELDDLHHDASLDGTAEFEGREFDRDALREVRKDWRRGNLPQLDTCSAPGCDEAAPFSLASNRPYCYSHAKDTA